MKVRILSVLLALMALPLAARTVTTLESGWTADGAAVTLPHTWNALDASDGKDVPPRKSTLWNYSAGSPSYARKVVVYRHALPDPKKGRRLFVRCGGASQVCTVRVNDRTIGKHIGAFTGFAFEITDALKTSGNVMEMIVDNVFDPDIQPINADYSVYGGLYRVPELIETGKTCIDPRRTPVVRADAKSGKVTVEVPVSDGALGDRALPAVGADLREQPSEARQPQATRTVVQEFDIPNFELWSPENPKLYPVTIRVADDELTLKVGFRSMEFREDGFYLNGAKRKLRGVCRHQDRAGKDWGRSRADEAEDVRWIKLMGADAVRTAHYPQSENFLDLCDEAGLIVWEELPNVNGLTFTPGAEANERMMAAEMVEQHRNHPCIFAWGIFNELYNKPMKEGSAEPRMTALSKYVNELDPTRPTVGASCRNWLLDLHKTPNQIGFNLYPEWAGTGSDTMKMKIDAAFATNATLRIAAVSEYGAGAGARQHAGTTTRAKAYDSVFHPQEYQAYHHWKCYRDIRDDPRIWGSFLWVMFDLGSDAKIEGEHVGMNDKGMVSWNRMIAKDAFYFYKANWNPEPMLHLVGDRLTDTTDKTEDILAFSNDGVVELFVNDVSLGKKSPDDVKGVLWEDVPLVTGDNKIEVVSEHFRETAHWMRRPPDFPKIGKARALTTGPKEHLLASYFGINSWSPDLRYVLALETDVNGRLSRENEPCTIGVIDTQDGNRFIPVSETRAWNFQEASMGHWLPWGEDMICFNDYRDGKFVTVVMNWRTKVARVIPHPIAAVSPDGRKAVSLNYARIRLTRPAYGYAGKGQDPLVKEPWPDDDGLWYMDLMTGEAKLIVPISKVRDVSPPVGTNGLFYFCHTVISRDGERIFWLGRGIDWYDPVKEKAGPWSTTAFTCKTDGSDIRLCFNGKKWGGSHFSWRDGKSMVVTVYPKEFPGAAWHATFTVGDEAHPHRLAPIALDFDGHCTWSADGEWMSTDGYIDPTGCRNWLLMRAEDEATVPVGSFFVPEKYRGGDWRCDLHGRWRPDGKQLGFNSTHEGSRQIYVIDLEDPADTIERKPPRAVDPVHEALKPYVDRGEIAGMVSVLSDPNGALTVDTLGWADAEKKRPMRLDTLFAVFSMSKTFFGAAMMCAIDDGRISLDDEVSKFLPEFADVKMKDGSKPKRPLVVRDLCCHVNGFRGGIPCVLRSVSLRDVARDLAKRPLETQPGEKFSYGTATIDAAAACLEVAVGRRYEDYLKERVLDPLGMTDTTFRPNADQLARLVKAYTTTGGPFRVARDHCTPQLEFPRENPIEPCAGGGLFSTPADMVRFSQMLAHHGEWKGRTIISRKTFDDVFAKIQTPAHVAEPYTVGSWLYGDWFGHEGAMRTDQRANLKTGHSRVFFIQTENKAGKAFFDAKTDWNRACDSCQKMSVPFSEEMVRTHENDKAKRPASGTTAFSPRMVHSAFGLDAYPDDYLAAIAKTGVDSILVYISKPPDVTRSGRREDIPALVRRAAAFGIGVYAYADFPVEAARLHPCEKGAEEWYEKLYGSIVRNAPGLKGLVCVGESVAFPYVDHRPTDYWWKPCPGGAPSTGFRPVRDWADWLRLVTKVTRKYKPDFDIVFWTYNWYRQPRADRLSLLEAIPTDISLLVTFEMGDAPVRKCGLDTIVMDYSITRPGPGRTFASEADVARRRGIRLYAMTNTGGRTWDFGLLPYEPVPWRWKDRFEAIRRARDTWGLAGLMESHHYGFQPNMIAELATRVYRDDYPPEQFDGILREIAVRDYGEGAADAVMAAWKDWSEAFEWHSAMAGDLATVQRNGPVYPLCLPEEDLPDPLHPVYEYHDGVRHGCGWKYTHSKFSFDLNRIDGEVEMADREIALLKRGCDRLEGLVSVRRQWAMGCFMLATIRTLRNAKLFYKACRANDRARANAVIDDETANVRSCFAWVDIDPQIGWEPTMGRVVARDTLEWKLRQLDGLRKRRVAKIW